MASPVVKTVQKMNFADAMKQVLLGKKVTKEEWQDKRIYGYLLNSYLTIRMLDDKDHNWIVNDGDIRGEDYFIVE